MTAGDPPHQLGAVGVLPADLEPEELAERLPRAGFVDARILSVHASDGAVVGSLALAARTAGRLRPEALDPLLPLLAVRLQVEHERTRRQVVEARFMDVERLATVGMVGAAVAHDVIQPSGGFRADGWSSRPMKPCQSKRPSPHGGRSGSTPGARRGHLHECWYPMSFASM